MKQTFVFAVICILFFAGCSRNHIAIKPQRTVIGGQIRNMKPGDNKVITAIYTDPILERRVAKKIDDKGLFHAASDMCFTQNMTLYLDDQFINILVSPADSLFLDIDMDLYRKGTSEGITFNGNSSHLEFNKQFSAFYDYICSNLYTEFDLNLPAEEYLEAFKLKLNEGYKKIDD